MDTQCYEVFRHNQASATGTTHCLVPTMSKRARSIICSPLDGAAIRDISKQSFRGIYDSAEAYQWTFGTQQMPSREVDMSRPQPIALFELEKALTSISKPVRCLHRAQIQQLYARAVAKYGQVADLSQAALALRVRYPATSSISKTFTTFVWYLRRITVSSAGISSTM